MLRISIRFPLGVYHARAAADEAEWPPNPLRLLGALLAAAHGRHGVDPASERALLQRLCEAPAPLIRAPGSVAVGEAVEAQEAVRLRGATRWAPRNYLTGALSTRNIGRERAAVSKAGVAVGDRPVVVIWPDLELSAEELERLAALASDVTFVGTTRSPAILEVNDQADEDSPEWTPARLADGFEADVTIRVPDPTTLVAFDRRHAARLSKGAGVQRAGMVPEIAIGVEIPYVSPRSAKASTRAFDAKWWGEMIVLDVDHKRSEVLPKAPAAYLLARAVRTALLGAFSEVGTPGDAPPILCGRDGEPHCAIVPLPSIWGPRPDGQIRSVALLLPHESRQPDVHVQRMHVEQGLSQLVESRARVPQRFVNIPDAGKIWLSLPGADGAARARWSESAYRGLAKTWVTVTPIVHSRWRKGGIDGLLRQVIADCAHVGLPAPEEIELLGGAGRKGGAHRLVPLAAVPRDWRGPLEGPTSHLRISFPRPVRGPLLIGRARHFGLGLCIPDRTAAVHEDHV
jgi:CRISPR-associated protein Csb2